MPEYCYSTDGETYYGPYATREEALAEGSDGLDPGDYIATAETKDIDYPLPFSADDCEERCLEILWDEVAELSEHCKFGTVATRALQTKLEALWEQWKREYNVRPGCFGVENVQEHVVPEGAAD